MPNILKAYLKNKPDAGNDGADLIMSEDGNGQLSLKSPRFSTPTPQSPGDKFPWNFERIELFDSQERPVFVSPTVALSVNKPEDYVKVDGINVQGAPGPVRTIEIKFHIPLLIGHAGNAPDQPTIAIKMIIYRSGSETRITSLEIAGDKVSEWPRYVKWNSLSVIFGSAHTEKLIDGSPRLLGPILDHFRWDKFEAQDSLVLTVDSKSFAKPVPVLRFAGAMKASSLIHLPLFGLAEFAHPARAIGAALLMTQSPTKAWIERTVEEEWQLDLFTDLDCFWNEAVKNYRLALKDVRSVDRMSLIPTIATQPNQNDLRTSVIVKRVISATAAKFDDLTFRLASIRVAPESRAAAITRDLAFDFGSVGKASRPNAWSASASIKTKEPEREAAAGKVVLEFEASVTGAKAVHTFRAGSLDIEMGTQQLVAEHHYAQLYRLEIDADTWRVPRLYSTFDLPASNLLPGGEDALPGSSSMPDGYSPKQDDLEEEAIERRFRGSSAIVITRDAGSAENYFLAGAEGNPELYNQTLRMQLNADKTATPQKQQLIVIDPDPFLVARVEFEGFLHSTDDGTIAIWDPVSGAWLIRRGDPDPKTHRDTSRTFTLTLPPQVIGEEMPKAFEFDDADKDDQNLKALNFRYSPLANQVLLGSYTPTNWAEVPWNLRRILGYPGQADPGAGVVDLSYELIYGLSCEARVPLLRLVEIFALLGEIPGRIDPNAPKGDEVAWKQLRTWWSRYKELYLSRVGVLQPATPETIPGLDADTGSAGETTQLTLSNGVSCQFRGDADLYYQARRNDRDQDSFVTLPGGGGLKGGVTWPFEAPRLLNATLTSPRSSSSSVTGLALSTLGASGAQKVGFDHDLTGISSVTNFGRTNRITVARLGRIGVFHNLARFVIQYERSVVPSKQFLGKQTPFQLRPVLRKVKVYVEILEPEAVLSSAGAGGPSAGFVKSLQFKSVILPVDSSWGSNEGESGWKIPLWRPPSAGSVYPMPEVVFHMAGTGKDEIVECANLTPDRLVFYTDTTGHADADPHMWPLVPDIDFSLCPVPEPNPEFPSKAVDEQKAHDAPVPFGLSSFTFEVAAGHGPVNLMYGRTAGAIGSVVSTLTLQRPPSAVPSLRTELEAIATGIRNDAFSHVRKLSQKGLDETVGSLRNKVEALTNRLDASIKQAGGLAKGVGEKETQLLRQWRDKALGEIDELDLELRAHLKDAINGANVDIARARLIAKAEVEALFERFTAIAVSPNALWRFVKTCSDAFDYLTDQLPGATANIQHAIDDANGRLNPRDDAQKLTTALHMLQSAGQSAIFGEMAKVQDLLPGVRAQVQAHAERWMPYAAAVCIVWEKTLTDILNASTSKVSTALTGAQNALDALAHNEVATAQALVTNLKTSLTEASSTVGAIGTKVAGSLGDLKTAAGPLTAVDDVVSKFLNEKKADVIKAIDAVPDLDVRKIDDFRSAIVKNLRDSFNNGLDTLLDGSVGIVAKAQTIRVAIENLAKEALRGEVKAALDSLQGSNVGKEAERLRLAAEDALGRFCETVVRSFPSIPIDVPLPSGKDAAAILHRAFGAAPTVPNLGFSLPNVGYFYKPALPNVSLTPLLTQVKDLGGQLAPLGSMVPSFQLLERVIPIPSLSDFDLSSIFPDFAGLKLTNLFPSLKMPNAADHGVHITHGREGGSGRAWVQADIELHAAPADLFSIGPLTLRIMNAAFTAKARMEADIKTGQVVRSAKGAITGRWELLLSGSAVIAFNDTSLTFDESGKVHVDISPTKVELSAALSFVQEIIKRYTSPANGFGISMLPSGVETHLSLPIPNTSVGTSGITNLTFGFLFGLSWAPDFEIYAGFSLARRDAPFNVAIFILGGGGYLEVTAHYRPGKSIVCQVEMALNASACLSVAFGPISGTVMLAMGTNFIYRSGDHGNLRIGMYLMVLGEVQLLGFVSASICLRLDATYGGGQFVCTGYFSIKIKICWCFTLRISQTVSCKLGGGGGFMAYDPPYELPWRHEPAITDGFTLPLDDGASLAQLSQFDQYAEDYIAMLA